jgi:hypothetical protein
MSANAVRIRRWRQRDKAGIRCFTLPLDVVAIETLLADEGLDLSMV